LHNLRHHPLRELRHRTPPFTRLPGRDLRGTRLRAEQRADRHGASPSGSACDDRRATQPRSADDPESPSTWAGVAITARTQERSTNIESVLGEFPDELDELVGSVAVAPGETEQFVHVLEHDSVLGCAGDSDSLAAAELQ
jgi:hypothetical protein